MVNKIEDLVEAFRGDLNTLKDEEILTQPFLVDKADLNFDGKHLKHDEEKNFQYENCSDRYLLTVADKEKFYTRQYFNFYRMRYQHFYPRIVENAKEILGHSVAPILLGGMKNAKGKVLIIGCLMKKMENRQAVLRDIEHVGSMNKSVVLNEEDVETLALDTDVITLEDEEKQTITLKGNIDPYNFVTGFVVGVYGTQIESTTSFMFDVEQVILPSLPPYIERPLLQNDIYVIFMSGFNLKPENSSFLGELNYFAQLFKSQKYYNTIARMIIAGNSAITYQHDQTISPNVMALGLTIEADNTDCALIASNAFRRYFANLDFDIMPGEIDPCPLMLPQQPMDTVLLEEYDLPANDEEKEEKKAKKETFDTKVETFKVSSDTKVEGGMEAKDYWMAESQGIPKRQRRSLNPVTNPYVFKVMGVEFHGTSGQNVNSFRKLTKKGKPTVEIMHEILESCHVVPTAPDFTDCFPFARNDGSDPLALDSLPHVFFAANQQEFGTKMVDFGKGRKVRLISIPAYDQSHSMVVVNLRTLEASTILSKQSPNYNSNNNNNNNDL